jgi:cysteine desulfurase / selenocysteine lyase
LESYAPSAGISSGSDHYLDHACLGRPTQQTLAAVLQAAASVAAPGTIGTAGTARTMRLLEAVEVARKSVARLIHSAPNNILLIENTTQALGWIASSLPVQAGDNVLVADVEFMGAALVWRHIARRVGVEIISVPTSNGRVLPQHFAAKANARTRAVMVGAVQEVSGFRTDLGALQEIASHCGAALIVDGIQEVGALPVDLEKCPVDAYCAAGHKWLRSPFGTGFAFVHPRLLDRLDPPFCGYLALQEPEIGWDHYMELADRSAYDPLAEFNDARRLATGGIPNWLGAVALGHSAEEFLQLGVHNVWQRILSLRSRLADGLVDLGFPLIAGGIDGASGMVCFRTLGGVEQDRALHSALTTSKVFVSLRYISGVGGLRVAVHEDNTDADVNALLKVASHFARTSS